MRVAVNLMAILLVVVGCGGDEPQATTEPTPSASPSSSVSPPAATPSENPLNSPIVGEWERVMTCQERVAALEQAGLGQFAAEHVAGNEMVPGISFDEPELIDPEHPCEGAVPRKHGHFFTSAGSFGSTDHQDRQVDDGTFEVVDASGCWAAQWAVAVASPGRPWRRSR